MQHLVATVALPLLTQSLYTVMEWTVKSTVQGSFYVLQQLYWISFQGGKHENGIPEFYRTLKSMDLENDLLCAQVILNQMMELQHLFPPNKTYFQSIIENVQSHIQEIHDLLWQCTEKIEHHKKNGSVHIASWIYRKKFNNCEKNNPSCKNVLNGWKKQ